jgi:hypothetical protein
VKPSTPITSNKTTFLEAALCSAIPFQGIQVNPLDLRRAENMIQEGGDHISAMTLIPVVAISDHDPQLCAPLTLIDIVVHTITNMLTVQGFNSEAAPSAARSGKFIGIVIQKISEWYPHCRGRVQASELLVASPGVVIFSILQPFPPEYDLLPSQHVELRLYNPEGDWILTKA